MVVIDGGNSKEKEIIVGIILGIFYQLNSFDFHRQLSEVLTTIIPLFPQKETGAHGG